MKNKEFSSKPTLSDSCNFLGKTSWNKLIFCVNDKKRHPCFVYFPGHFQNLILYWASRDNRYHLGQIHHKILRFKCAKFVSTLPILHEICKWSIGKLMGLTCKLMGLTCKLMGLQKQGTFDISLFFWIIKYSLHKFYAISE